MRMAREGIIDELPKELCRNLELQDRIELLRMLLQMVRQGKYELYLLDEHKMKYPRELFLWASGMQDVSIMYLSDKDNLRFALDERRMTKLFFEFLSGFMQTPYVCSSEKTLMFLESVIRKCEVEMNDCT